MHSNQAIYLKHRLYRSGFFVLFFILLSPALSSQVIHSLKGKVIDEKNLPLSGATIILQPGNLATITDTKGEFSFSSLSANKQQITISYIGYQTYSDSIYLSKSNYYEVKLKLACLNLEEVEVTDDYIYQRKKDLALSVDIVNETFLKRNQGGSLMSTIERLPGVSSIAIGSGQSKPIIRGLAFNRVAVVENGIRHEGQQWGADHGLEIDQFAVNHLEVIKGPASLMYGSEAIGGLILIKDRKIPAENTVGGTIDLNGKSNNKLAAGSLYLYGRRQSLLADFRLTAISFGDYRVPVDSVDIYSYRAPLQENHLRNTAGNEINLHGTIGYIKRNHQTRLKISNTHSKAGFFANAHGLEPRMIDTLLHDVSNRDIQHPYQSVDHFKLMLMNGYSGDGWKLETDIAFQSNKRFEWSPYVSHGYMPAVFPGEQQFPAELERAFDKQIYSGAIKLELDAGKESKLQLGLQSDYQNNKIDGRGFIIPAYRQLNEGIFIIGQHAISKNKSLFAGIRADFGQIQTDSYSDWFLSPSLDSISSEYLERAKALKKNFQALSWSLGYVYQIDQLITKINLGKSFRMPIAKELAANGVNYHHFSYEIGNPDLNPEISYQLDILAEYANPHVVAGITPFVNYFSNYIYLNPTPAFDRLYGNGNQIFEYTEASVFRYGAELHAHYKINKDLQLGLIGEYVHAKQLNGAKKGYALPFTPPASGILNLKYQKKSLWNFNDFYLSMDIKFAAAQKEIVPPEEITDGYQILNFIIGADLLMKDQKVSLSIQVQNVLNTVYFNHTSYYRLINVPEAGRNLILTIHMPFAGSLKNRNNSKS